MYSFLLAGYFDVNMRMSLNEEEYFSIAFLLEIAWRVVSSYEFMSN